VEGVQDICRRCAGESPLDLLGHLFSTIQEFSADSSREVRSKRRIFAGELLNGGKKDDPEDREADSPAHRRQMSWTPSTPKFLIVKIARVAEVHRWKKKSESRVPNCSESSS